VVKHALEFLFSKNAPDLLNAFNFSTERSCVANKHQRQIVFRSSEGYVLDLSFSLTLVGELNTMVFKDIGQQVFTHDILKRERKAREKREKSERKAKYRTILAIVTQHHFDVVVDKAEV
jgi:hypothetical protein